MTIIKQVACERNSSIRTLFDKYEMQVREIMEKEHSTGKGASNIKRENESEDEEEKLIREKE